MALVTSQVEDIFVAREHCFKALHKSILNLNLNHEEHEKIIITNINRLLSQAKNRKEGLDYLLLILDHCSTDSIAKNAMLWISYCLVKYSDDCLREIKLRTVAKIIEIAYNEPDFNKKFVSEHLSKVVETCLETSRVNTCECKAALSTLTTCMRYYPSWFTSHRQKVEKFVLIFLDKNDEELVAKAAEAFHYMQQVGGAGSEGINHKASFSKNFQKLCDTVNHLFNKLLEGETELFYTATSSEDVIEFQDDFMAHNESVIARRIKNCLTFIELMIRTKFTVAKEIRPQILLDIITRGTSIHRCITKNQNSLNACQSSLLLTGIQVKLLRMLRLFIIWLKTSALLFSYQISKVLVDNLERCQNCDCFKHESLYQETIYKSIEELLKICKSSFHSHFQEQLVKCILKDVTPIKSQVTLNISEGPSKGESAKSKRKSIENKIITSGQVQSSRKLTFLEMTSSIVNCKFALGTLKCLLEFSRLDVKSTILKEIYKSVFDAVTTVQFGPPIHPYTDPRCQAKLYEVLVAFYHQDRLGVLPPLQTTLNLLTRGVNSSNRFVSDICERGIRTLEVLCQPVCPYLYQGYKPTAEDTRSQQNGHANDFDRSIEFSPIHSPEVERRESSMVHDQSYVDEDISINLPQTQQTVPENKENTTVSYEINDAENDNNTNMEIEQQAEIQKGESIPSTDGSLIPTVGDDAVEVVSFTKQVEEDPPNASDQDEDEVIEIVELDNEEPPTKKHKTQETEKTNVPGAKPEERKDYNLRSKTKTVDNVNQTEKIVDSASEVSDKVDMQLEAADAVAANADLNIENPSNDKADIQADSVDVDANNDAAKQNVANASLNIENDEGDDNFVDKVLDSFVDEVKEY